MRIGVEACGGAHYWARTSNKLGHDARIMAVNMWFLTELKGRTTLMMVVAICEAVQRLSTRFVPIKSPSSKPSYRYIE